MNESDYCLDPEVLCLTTDYSEVFGNTISTNEIQNFVAKLDMYKSISIVCELISLRNKSIISKTDYLWWDITIDISFDNAIKHFLLKYCHNNNISMLSPIKNNINLLTLQSLLTALKLLFAYGNYDTVTKSIDFTEDDYFKVIKLSLISNGLLNTANLNPSHFIYGNYHLNQINNIGSEILRAYNIYCEICRQKSNLPVERQKEYLDINADFNDRYGYGIDEYLAVLFLLTERDLNGQAQLSYNPVYRDLNKAYINCKKPNNAKRIISSLSVDLNSVKSWAESSLDSWWDFSVFMEKPIILLPNNQFVSISDRTLINGMFEKLYWHIRACYPQETTKFNSFIGRIFEQYVQSISKESVLRNPDYTYYSEFYFSTKDSSRNLSSDSYIVKGKKMLVVEAKSYQPLFNSIRYCDDKAIVKSIEKLFIKPVLQVDEINNKLLSSDQAEFIKIIGGMEELIAVSVTIDGVQAVPEYYNDAISTIKSQKKLDSIKYCLNLSIREYEYLLSMIENKIDIFTILEGYLSQKTIQPFYNYSTSVTKHTTVRTAYMEDLFHKCSEKLRDCLF